MAPLPSVEWEAKREAVGREDREARGSLTKPPQGTAEQAWKRGEALGQGQWSPAREGGGFLWLRLTAWEEGRGGQVLGSLPSRG